MGQVGTTNCPAALVKVLHEHCSIVSGQMTTIHSYTVWTQGTVDRRHKDLYRARAGAMSMIQYRSPNISFADVLY